jgi:two-component system cell cycle response regulator
MGSVSFDRVLSCPSLPSLPGVAVEVLELTRDANVNLRRIAESVQNDAALTGKILRTVNSSFYGLTKPCPSISRAIGYLGLNTVKSLVLGFSLVDAINGGGRSGSFDYMSFWRRGVYGAAGARLLADATRAFDPEEAFTAGLLQDIGMIALLSALREEYERIVDDVADAHPALIVAERRAFETDHAQVGAMLAEKWRLPASFVESIRLHHDVERASGEHRDLVRLVALANLAAAALTVPDRAPVLASFRRNAAEWFSLKPDRCDDLFVRMAEGAAQLSSLFRLDTGRAADARAVLDEAGEQLLAHQVSIQTESTQLRESNQRLVHESITDALTGARNRRHFDERLPEAFDVARLAGGAISVVFVDGDRFKSVNDVHGHGAGDQVLREIARRLKGVVEPAGLVARYGGEEFVAMLPNHDRRAAATLAERARRAIEAAPIRVDSIAGGAIDLPVTISVGAAAYEPSAADALPTANHLVKAADRAMYAAKAAGRNCVRVFKPGPHRASAPGAHPLASPACHILLVEDDPLAARFIVSAFESVPGARCTLVGSAEEARRALDAADPPVSMVVCDQWLPGKSGIELVRDLRADAARHTLPIVVTSASSDERTMQECLRAGASAFCAKSRFSEDAVGTARRLIDEWCGQTAAHA